MSDLNSRVPALMYKLIHTTEQLRNEVCCKLRELNDTLEEGGGGGGGTLQDVTTGGNNTNQGIIQTGDVAELSTSASVVGSLGTNKYVDAMVSNGANPSRFMFLSTDPILAGTGTHSQVNINTSSINLINTVTGSSTTSLFLGSGSAILYAQQLNDNITLNYSVSGNVTTFTIDKFGGVYGSQQSRPLKYAADYSANYNDRSIVDKAYVDGRIGGASGSFTSQDGKTVTVVNGLITSIV